MLKQVSNLYITILMGGFLMAVYCKQLVNMDNYLVFQELARTGYQTIYTKDINEQTHLSYFNGLMNILRDILRLVGLWEKVRIFLRK